MRIIQALALVANVVFLGFVVFLWVTQPPKGKDVAIVLAISAFPLLNILALIGILRRSKPSIVELYFAVRRANLEKQLAETKT
jgi:hypothetical protein